MTTLGLRLFRSVDIPHDAVPLVRQLFVEAAKQQVAICDLSDRSGINKNTLKDWRTRTVPTVSNLEAVGNVLGLELVWRRRP